MNEIEKYVERNCEGQSVAFKYGYLLGYCNTLYNTVMLKHPELFEEHSWLKLED